MELTESYLLLKGNTSSLNAIIPKDDDSKRLNTHLEAIHSDTVKNEEQRLQKSSLSSFNQNSIHIVTGTNTQALPDDIINSASSEQHARRTVTFDDDTALFQSISNRPIRTSYVNFRLPNHGLISNDQQEAESSNNRHSLDNDIGSGTINLTTPDLTQLLSKDEYIPGGFANLDHELEEEFLNDFADEFDDETTRRNRHSSSIRPSDSIVNVTRSPIELWQRVRILIAVHLYKIQNKTLHPYDNTFSTSTVIEPSKRKIIDNNRLPSGIDEFDYIEKLFEQKENIEEQKITFGLSIIQQFSLDSSQQYQCVDFYDVGQGYIFTCNVVNLDVPQVNIKDYSNLGQLQSCNKSNNKKCQVSEPILNLTIDSSLTKASKLVIYPINKKSSNKIQSIEFDCPFRFNFMICIPILRLILSFINIKQQKSLMIIIGDASRKGIFISKQEIPDYVHSILYIHESTMLFVGCMGRVLLYNTQPLQFTSQPLFVSELTNLPFQSMEPIIHICHVITYRSIGLLSNRYFVLWQYTSEERILTKFCNPYRYDFIRCHYNSKFDYIIFAFIDGFILIYQIHQMKPIRRYHYHWKMITDLENSKDQNLLLSSSIDHVINVWNLETLQHLYQYNANEEIFQIDVIHENLFYYRTLKHIILFKLNLNTILFSTTKTKIKSLKLFTDMHRTARVTALSEDNSCILISPVSGCCLTYVSNIAKKPIKQILHDISRSSIYLLQFDGEIVLYRADNNPCVAEYKIRTKSEQYAITCMTLINPMRTQLFNIHTMQTSTEKSLEKQVVFFGHANGYISLFQGESLVMEPILAHKNSILCLETSRASMDMSNILFTNCEILLSSSIDRIIYLWNLTINKSDDCIQLIHILTIEQEKNISFESIKYLSMVDNFIVANYSDQSFLHIWQLLNISIRTSIHNQWGIVEHPTKGSHHHGQIQAITATPKLKLFASSDSEGYIKIWDNTNSLLREIYLDKSLCAIEFLLQNGELIIAYQNNIHLILPENYLPNYKKFKIKQQNIINYSAENNRLEISQPLSIPYQLLPIFVYHIKTHHRKKRLQRFERQLEG
ncbi:unnamed protein product [Rotaria sp. Silwood1]|nr:unnamed protein product [Rotaria sp. Silwood1]